MSINHSDSYVESDINYGYYDNNYIATQIDSDQMQECENSNPSASSNPFQNYYGSDDEDDTQMSTSDHYELQNTIYNHANKSSSTTSKNFNDIFNKSNNNHNTITTSTPLQHENNKKSDFGRSSSFENCVFTFDNQQISPDNITTTPVTPMSTTKCLSGDEHSPNSAHSPIVSRLANDFDIVNVIGTGTFGTVYRVKGKIDEVLYAVKRSIRRFRGSLDRTRMMHEVHALAALSANEDVTSIVRYYSAWIEEDHVLIQMELCETSIEEMMKLNYKFKTTEIFQILRDVLLALKVLHKNDFVHLDIKPANILLKSGHFKLGDFGLALHVVNGKASPGTIEEGDSRYMAKELLDWKPVEDLTKCDIFSLGITAFEVSSCGCHKLEAHGPEWHLLRNGITSVALNNAFNNNNLFALQDINGNHSLTNELSLILSEMLAEIPKNRPSAQFCLDSHYELKSKLEKEVHVLKLRLEKEVNKNNFSASSKTKLKRHNTIT